MTQELLPLSEVAFMPPFPSPAPVDEVGELAWLDLRDLFIDPRYQRPIGARGEKNIRQVIENFSWSLFSPIVVGPRPGGKFAVIDGQHRAIAALTHGGIEKVPALIVKGGPHAEAKAFSVINGAVTAILPTQIWHARVVAEEHDAVMLSRVLDDAGVTILRTPKPADKIRAGETVAIDAIEGAYRKYGRAALSAALKTVTRTKDGNPGYLRAPLIKAAASVLAENPEWDEAFAIRATKTVGVKYLWALAEKRRAESNPKPTIFAAYANAFRNVLRDVAAREEQGATA